MDCQKLNKRGAGRDPEERSAAYRQGNTEELPLKVDKFVNGLD